MYSFFRNVNTTGLATVFCINESRQTSKTTCYSTNIDSNFVSKQASAFGSNICERLYLLGHVPKKLGPRYIIEHQLNYVTLKKSDKYNRRKPHRRKKIRL